jgi:hypothetical protein
MADKDKQTDDDIQQAKKDVLRASDIIPSSSKRNKPDPPPLPPTRQKEFEMPSFDLAEDIMAEQRKITAIKRKAPGNKIKAQSPKPQVEPVGYAIGRPTTASPEQDRIIAEIVARDIKRLCRGKI